MCVCGRDEVMRSVGEPGWLWHATPVPQQRRWRSYRGDQCTASDWLKYNQKRLKAKHNGHLLVYPGHYPSKPGTICS